MSSNFRLTNSYLPTAAIALAALALVASPARGETEQLSQPVYRVAADAAAVAAPSPAGEAPSADVVLDFIQQEGEHPLAPVIRACKSSLDHIDQNIRDYSCTLVKRERVDGELGEAQHIFMKMREEPFSVYMQFLQPFQGREVLYVDGQHDNEMIVLEAGFKRKLLGKMQLDPEGMVAMRGQKYPITKVGIKNLLHQIIERSEADLKYAECEVKTKENMSINGRSTTMVQIVHPIPRQNFRTHIARIFFDKEHLVPIHYDSFLWPEQTGGQPPLEESYTYTNLKINNGFAARDFDSSNPDIFKP